jgi:acyl-CoA synthetase (AMP-forming)/AMP-acid ligase II
MHGAAALIERLDIDDHDVYPVAFPVTHVGGVVILTTFLVTGAHLALFDSFDAATSPARFAAHGATLLGTAVPFFNAYLAAQAKAGDTPLFPKLRACIGGGAPVPTEIHLALERAFGVAGVVGSWGLTEFPNATCARCDDPADVMTGSVGRAGTGVEIRTVDEAGVDVAAGAEGELVLRGPQQLVGYVNPALDEAGFFPDRWFRTGDLGRIDDGGNVWITGRLKDIIIRNAENISVLEIENVLSQHPEVLEATVIGMPDARTGERVCAIVVTRDATHLDLDALRAHCDALGLARHKIPEQIEHLDVLPRNAMGKVLKQQLRAQFV